MLTVGKMIINRKHLVSGLVAITLLLQYLATFGQSIDSLEVQLARSTHDSTRYGLLFYLTDEYVSTQPAKAIEYGLQFIELAEKHAQLEDLAYAYSVLGEASFYMTQMAQAENFFLEQLNTSKELKDSSRIASALTNLGVVAQNTEQFNKAIGLYQEALIIRQHQQDTLGLSGLYNNIGVLHEKLNLYGQAMDYYQRSFQIELRNNNQEGIATSLLNIGALFRLMHQQDSALIYLNKSMQLADSLDFSITLEMAHESLAQLYKDKGDYRQALGHKEQTANLKEMRLNQHNADKVAELTHTFRFKEQAQTIDKLNRSNRLRQRVNYLTLGIIVIASFFSFLLWRENRKRKQNNLVLIRQNKEILQKNEEIATQRDKIVETRDQLLQQNQLLKEQRELLAKQKKDLTDSLEYARHIQNALMPDNITMKRLLGDGFYLFLPRDIVSGDFYWGCQIHDKQLIVSADATGHGVPGAFLSIIGINFLNEVVHNQGISEPALILSEMRKRMIKLLVYSDKFEEAKDSIDMGIVLIDRKQQQLTYAGAYHHLFLIRNNMLEVIKADKMCVGISNKGMLPFTSHTLTISPNDCCYLFSDGYPDQFGGSCQKKLRIGKFKDLLLSYHTHPMEEQKKLLFNYFVNWKKGLPQVDDVLLLGIHF